MRNGLGRTSPRGRSHSRTHALTHSRTHALTHSRTHALTLLLPLRDEVLRGEIGHLAREVDLVAGDDTGVLDRDRVALELEPFGEGDGVPLRLDILEHNLAGLTGELPLRRPGEGSAVLLEGEDVLLRADLRVELRAPGAGRTLRSGDAGGKGEQQNQVSLHVAVLRDVRCAKIDGAVAPRQSPQSHTSATSSPRPSSPPRTR